MSDKAVDGFLIFFAYQPFGTFELHDRIDRSGEDRIYL